MAERVLLYLLKLIIMLEIYDALPDLYKTLLGAGGGLFLGWITTYSNEKIKQKALEGDNEKLTEENERIKSKYNKELAIVRRDHELDISKRKYRYESKSKSYIEFFSMLDLLNSNLNTTGIDKLKESLEEYNRNTANAIKESAQKKATIVFQKKVQAIILDSNKDLIKLRHETNSIRLIASDSVISKLDLLEKGFEILMNESNKLLSKMPVLILSNDEEVVNVAKAVVISKGSQVEEIKKDLITIMRIELN